MEKSKYLINKQQFTKEGIKLEHGKNQKLKDPFLPFQFFSLPHPC